MSLLENQPRKGGRGFLSELEWYYVIDLAYDASNFLLTFILPRSLIHKHRRMASVEDETVTALITSVYNDVWDEFYAWEQDYCASEIRSLQRDAPPNADASEESRESEPAELVTPQSFFTNAFIDSDLLHWEYPAEVVERRDDTENLIDYQIVHLKAPKLSPTPHYESCNPMSTSILAGDDPDEMPFIPFPGSAGFEFDAYRNQHEKFSWENERMDPDSTSTLPPETARTLTTPYRGDDNFRVYTPAR